MSSGDCSVAESFLMRDLARSLGAMGFNFREDALRTYARLLLEQRNGTFISAQEAQRGLGEIYPLTWDSNIYNRKIGATGILALSPALPADRLRLTAEELAKKIADQAWSAGFEMLVVRIAAEDIHWAQAFGAMNFRLMDLQTPLFLRTEGDRIPPGSSTVNIRSVAPQDIPEILSFGRSIFSKSHFYADDLLPAEDTDRLHEQWIRNDLDTRAWVSLLAEDNAGICGFVTALWDENQEKILELRHAHIDLLAVKPDRRGRGIGEALTAAALQRFLERKAHLVTVSTQGTNLAAIRLYLRAGFQLASPQLTLHGWATRMPDHGKSGGSHEL